MKKTVKYLIAAVLLVSAASCSKEPMESISNGSAMPDRIITASFDNSSMTRTTLDGRNPKWASGDSLVLIDDQQHAITCHLIPADATATPDVANMYATLSDDCSSFKLVIPGNWGWSEKIYAFYPASSFVKVEDDKMYYRIPHTQNGTFGSANICLAKLDGSSLAFKNAVSIIKLSEVGEGIDYVSVLAKNITGVFVVGNPGEVPVATEGIGKAAIHSTGSEYYAAVAPVAVPAESWLLFEDADHTIVGAKQTAHDNAFELGKLYNLGSVSKNDQIPEGMIRQAYTISEDGRTIHFAKAGLRAVYNGSGYTWEFAPNQYNFLSNYSIEHNGNLTIANPQVGDIVDVFSWVGASGSEAAFGITDATDAACLGTDPEPLKSDWGAVFGPNSIWRTPEGTLFQLLNKRNTWLGKDDMPKYANISISVSNGSLSVVNGLLIFPDNFEWTDEMGAKPGNLNNGTKIAFNGSYTLDNFKAMEDAGCVFFPARGHKCGSAYGNQNKRVYLWLNSPAASSKAYCVLAQSGSNLTWAKEMDRKNSYEVRLITE